MARPCITILAGCLTLLSGTLAEVEIDAEAKALQQPLCSYFKGDADGTEEEEPSGKLVAPDVKQCKVGDACFAFFTYFADNDTIEFLVKGCWETPNDCQTSACVGLPRGDDRYFCCCRGNMCNLNVEVSAVREEPSPSPDTEHKNEKATDKSYLWLWALLIVAFVFLGTCIVVGTRHWRKRNRPPPLVLPPEEHPASPCIDLDSVKILETIGQGRFGTAYRAIVDEEEVAVKMFPQHHKSSYTNEKYIYSLPLMEHSNLLSYLGSGERVGQDGNIYYGLVLSYCPKGRLSTYLSENTLTWSTFCSVALSATRGLAHLHSEIRKGDIIKPCICHRDFNTRNLLLTENMHCVVSDLGFAIHTQGSKYYMNGEEQHAETSSLTDVGTLRYMAPEVLEGAVNLRDCEAALKQIDIYALGLVLWECAARCHDLYQGLQTPPYMLPFQAEIGLHPTFEQVQVLVVRNKARPLFPSVWKDTNPAIRLLKETIDDCWDYDAEARLSAMCVEGRLSELPVLWDRYKSSLGISGVSPTMNPLSNLPLSQRAGEMFNGSKIISNAITPREKESSVSEATVETTITGSPSEPPADVFLAKNQLIGTLQPPIPSLQPHQGRNPCMERNLIREIPQEISVSGNILIDPLKSNDINSINTINAANLMDVQHAIESHGLTNEQLMPLLNGHSNTANVVSQPRPTLPPPTLVPPIPYLQNEVHSIDNQPKRQNTALQEENHDNRKASKGSSWRRWRSAWEDRLKSLIPRRRHHNGEDEERQEIITPTSSSLSEPPTPLPATQSVAVTSHLPLQTEVLLTNGGPHTVISPNHALNSQHSTLPNYSTETEIGIAKLHFQNGFAPIIRSRQGSKDSGLNKSSENSVSFVDSDNSCEKLKRPTTLILPDRSHKGTVNKAVEEETNPSVNQEDHSKESKVTDSAPEVEESPPLRKAKHRVKTPRRPMNPRLSLYDDRIMGCDGERSVQSAKGGSGHLDVGLSHSLPLHMNALGGQQPFLTTSVAVSSASSQNNSAASLRCSKLASTVSSSSNSSNSSRASSRDGSQGLLGQELTFSCTQPNPQTIGVL